MFIELSVFKGGRFTDVCVNSQNVLLLERVKNSNIECKSTLQLIDGKWLLCKEDYDNLKGVLRQCQKTF